MNFISFDRAKRTRGLTFMGAAALIVLCAPLATAQQPQQPQQPPTSSPPSPQGQAGQTPASVPQNVVNKTADAITQNRKDLGQPATSTMKPLVVDPVKQIKTDLNTPVSFKVIGRDLQLGASSILTYAMVGAPPGAFLDPMSGEFSWKPSQPGDYEFLVGVTDGAANPRFASTSVSIEVNQPLQPFGYNFFSQPRAFLQYRLIALTSPLNTPYGLLAPPPYGQQPYAVSPANSQQLISNYQQAQQSGILSALQNNFSSSIFNQALGSGAIIPPNTGFTGPLPSGGNGTGSAFAPLNPFGQGQNQGQGQGQGQQNGSPLAPGIGSSNIGVSPTGGPANAQMTPIQAYLMAQMGALQNGGSSGQNNTPGGSGMFQSQTQGLQGGITGGSGFGGQGGNLLSQLNPQTLQQLLGSGNSNVVGNNGSPINFGNAPSNGQIYQPGPQNGGNSPSANAVTGFVGPWDQLEGNVWMPAPDRYQLGPGDLLTLEYWSPAYAAQSADLKIDSRGEISIPTSGRKIILRGLTINRAQDKLVQEMARDIKDVKVSLTMKALRTMQLVVLGNAYEPGNYQVPATATLFNALYMFGGPSDNGSMRDIELRRSDGTKKVLDLYKYLLHGDASEDVPLQPGDTIFIPPVLKQVSIKGEVHNPAIYEALPNEKLKELLAFAGGARATGVTQRLSLETVQPGVGHVYKDVDLNSTAAAGDPEVYDGDVAEVFSIREDYTNQIDVDGDVDQPGKYAFEPGLTVADVIGRARGLVKDAYTVRADLFRLNPDRTTTLIPVDLQKALNRDPAANVPLKKDDHLVVYSLRDVTWVGERQVQVNGAVQRPGSFYRSDNMKVMDLLLQAGGLTPDAYKPRGFLQRINPDGTTGPLLNIDLNKLAAFDPQMNTLLQDKDVLTIQTVQEANYIPDQTVTIAGAVQTPGNFPRSSDMTIADLIHLAGGPTPRASGEIEISHAHLPFDAPRTKLNLKDVVNGGANSGLRLKDGDLVTMTEDSDIIDSAMSVTIIGDVKHPGPYPINGRTDRLSELIDRAGGFGPDAYANGAQFFREPDKLDSDSQVRVQPRVLQAFNEVTQDEYTRLVAKSDVDKARIMSQINTPPSNVTLPLPNGQTVGVNQGAGGTILGTLFMDKTVTPARAMSIEDLTPGGNININLVEAMKRRTGRQNIVLHDGDIVIIPQTPTSVTVVGAVIAPSSALFKPDARLGYYVRNSGGYSIDAAQDRILVIGYNGIVRKGDSHTIIHLGDVIFVPTHVMAEKLSDKQSQIDAISRDVTSGALVLAIILSLLKF